MGSYGLFCAPVGYPMIDLHCHILPGVDDGSDSADTSCRMAAMAADSGVRYIVATPHCNTRDPRKNYRSVDLIEAYKALQEELDFWNIPIKILPGAEILVRGNFAELLESDRLMTLNGSRYLLTEFYFDESPRVMTEQLLLAERWGLVPVIAHPERYFCVQDDPALVEPWVDRGWVLQLNKGSILGDLGERAYDVASLLLRRGLAAVIASDAHHYRYRTTAAGPLLELLELRFPDLDPLELLQRNPMRIVRNQSLPPRN